MCKKKGFISLMLSIVLCVAMCMPVAASEGVDTLVPVPPATAFEIGTRGADPPSSRADIHDLSVSAYNYQVTDMGYRVYSGKWLTGASSIDVSVENWNLIKEYHGATNNKLTIRIYDSSKKQVASDTIFIYYGGGSTSFTGLTATANYYVCVEVPTNGNRYSFNGTISKR